MTVLLPSVLCMITFSEFFVLFFSQSFGEDGEEMDWSKYHVVGTCEDLEKPYLRLTSVSSTTCKCKTHVVYTSI